MRTVTVTGSGSARAVPDTVVARVAAVVRAPGVAAALEGASSAASLIADVSRRHTDPALIATTNLSIWPAYDQTGQPSGFEARHGFAVSCADVTAAGDLLAELAQIVGDQLVVEGISLEVSDLAAALVSARSTAFADAVAKATHLAELAGATLGEAQSVSEGAASFVGGREYDAKLSAAAPIEPGETSVPASVTVTFQLV